MEALEVSGGPLPAAAPLLRSLREVHFLDVGLNCRGAYTTDPGVVHSLGAWCRRHPGTLSLLLHGTPRQWGAQRDAAPGCSPGSGPPSLRRRVRRCSLTSGC